MGPLLLSQMVANLAIFKGWIQFTPVDSGDSASNLLYSIISSSLELELFLTVLRSLWVISLDLDNVFPLARSVYLCICNYWRSKRGGVYGLVLGGGALGFGSVQHMSFLLYFHLFSAIFTPFFHEKFLALKYSLCPLPHPHGYHSLCSIFTFSVVLLQRQDIPARCIPVNWLHFEYQYFGYSDG